MRNRTYGGVRGRKTKVGRKLLRFPPTRLNSIKDDTFLLKNLVDSIIFITFALSNNKDYNNDKVQSQRGHRTVGG